MDSEPIADFGRHFCAKDIRQGFAAMYVQVMHYQMNCRRLGLGHRQLHRNLIHIRCPAALLAREPPARRAADRRAV